MRRAVFLDRDGVINRAIVREGRPYPPDSVTSLDVLDGVPDALEKLRAAGFMLIVVTNQPDVARGKTTRQSIERMHENLIASLALDEVIACYHDGDACDCRKPKPGALIEAAQRQGIELESSYMIGDRWRDIEAGQQVGCKCLFIDYGYLEKQPSPPFVRVTSLAEAADLIIGDERNARHPLGWSECT